MTIKQADQAILHLHVKGSTTRLWRCPDVSVGQIIGAAERDDSTGICVLCGAEQSGCEPDARRYTCEVCGGNGVFGAEELLVRLTNP